MAMPLLRPTELARPMTGTMTGMMTEILTVARLDREEIRRSRWLQASFGDSTGTSFVYGYGDALDPLVTLQTAG